MSQQTYIIITWPESQELMDLPGFRENSYLINDDKGITDFGSSAYFVRKGWLPMDIEDIKEALKDYMLEKKPTSLNLNEVKEWLRPTDLNKTSKSIFIQLLKQKLENEDNNR